MVTKMSTLYNHGERKSISECRICQTLMQIATTAEEREQDPLLSATNLNLKRDQLMPL